MNYLKICVRTTDMPTRIINVNKIIKKLSEKPAVTQKELQDDLKAAGIGLWSVFEMNCVL